MKKLISLIIACLALTILSFTITTPSEAAPDCMDPKHENKPACTGNTGEDAIEYTAELTMGGFIFSSATKTVTPNSRSNTLNSEDGVFMYRTAGVGATAQDAWNQMFETCANLLTGVIDDFSVGSDNWSIQKAGSDDIRVIFNDILLQEAEVTVQLIGVPEDDFLPDSGETSEFTLLKGAIYGKSVKGNGPRRGCQPSGGGGFEEFTLKTPSVLTIKRD